MRRLTIAVAVAVLILETQSAAKTKGILLERLTWVEAEKILGPDTIVVIPLGAAAKEHGPHLPLNNDWLQAEYFKGRVVREAEVVIAPTINYSYYPAFLEYPGSTSLSLETARDAVVDICTTLSRYGPRRFYVINTGISTLRPLEAAATILATRGIALWYSDLHKILTPLERTIAKQEGGSHADEIETSVMLYIAPNVVDMSKAVKDFHPGEGPLTRDPSRKGAYSRTGIYGDATLATRAKGKLITEGIVNAILRDIEELRSSALPALQPPP